jgi:hypothetical protein
MPEEQTFEYSTVEDKDSLDQQQFSEKIGGEKLVYKEAEERATEQAVEKSSEHLKPSKIVKKVVKKKRKNNLSEVELRAEEIVKLDVEEQIAHLVKIAEQNGPYLAIDIAKHLADNYVLSNLHSDLTTDKVINTLEQKGLL